MATAQLVQPGLRTPFRSSVSCPSQQLRRGSSPRPAFAFYAEGRQHAGLRRFGGHAKRLASSRLSSLRCIRPRGLAFGSKEGLRGASRRATVVRAVFEGPTSDAVVAPDEPLKTNLTAPDPEKARRAAIPPILIGIITALYTYPKIIPWARAHLQGIRAGGFTPVHVGIRPLDTYLGLLVQFFEDVLVVNWGPVALSSCSALLLSWALAAGIESARLDTNQAPLLQYFSAFAPWAIVLGAGVIIPIAWVAPYLRIPGNTTPSAELTPAIALAKTLPTPHVRALNFAILLSAAVYFQTRFTAGVNPMLLLLLPLLWQLAAAPPAWLGITDVTVIGHREAERIHIFAAGIGMLQHFTCVNALLRNPGLLRGMVRAFWVHPMWARPALFVLANTLGLWAALMMIPLAQEGIRTALKLALSAIFLGPATTVSLYFADREAHYELLASEAPVTIITDETVIGMGYPVENES